MIGRRWVAWLLCCMFLFNGIGYWITVALVQQQLKNDALQRLGASLPETALTLIQVPLTDFEKINQVKDGELNINDNLYDVVRTRMVGQVLFCYCLSDMAEETLLKKTDDHLDTAYNISSKASTDPVRVLKQSGIDNFVIPIGSTCHLASRQYKYALPLQVYYQSAIYRLIAPPPKPV